MFKLNLENIVENLKKVRVKFTKGLTEEEVARIELLYGIQFPPDVKELLMFALPVSKEFVNWRDESEERIRERLNWPLEGLLVDVEENGFWMKQWGERPASLQQALQIAAEQYQQAPALIPIYSHRYIPSTPHRRGNPVFSVYQTDIIYYGADLSAYFRAEFGIKKGKEDDQAKEKFIPFWSEIAHLDWEE